MAWIDMVPEGAANGELKELYLSAAEPASGRVDNILKIHSLNPRGLAGHLELYRAVMRPTPTLRLADRELIAVVVSKLNHCDY